MNKRVHLIRTRWSHWGAHAGIIRFAEYVDSPVRIYDHAATHGDDDLPGVVRGRARVWLKRRVERTMPWYTLSDLWAEAVAGVRCGLGRADIVHYLDPEHGVQYLPRLVRRLPWRIRVIATFHQPPSMLPSILREDVVRSLDHATVVSPDQLEYFAQFLPEDRISVILHGIDTTYFQPAPYVADGDRWTCLTVGHNLRDFDVLRGIAQYFRADESVHFDVVAPRETGVEDLSNVTVHRNLSDADLRAMYQRADVLLLPLRAATANNALLEAFACALPAVVTDLPGIRAYAPGEESILIAGSETEPFVGAICRIREDRSLRARMALAARRRAEELSWERVGPAYGRLYDALVD
jgi:glycosyltransferase involved in cell wall biosynthesis